MFLYKLKKIFRERKLELFASAYSFAVIASFLPLFSLVFLWNQEFSRSDRRSMLFTSVILSLINFGFIWSIDFIWGLNIIISILLGYVASFLAFFIPCLIYVISFEWAEIELNKAESREVKLKSISRNLF